MRDLCRARAEAIHARKTAQCRLNACLLRHDIRSPGRAPWGPAPLRWRSAVVCPTPAQQSVFQADLRAVPDHTDRLARLAHERTDQGPPWRLAPVGDALQALRGGQGPVAGTPVAARGDRTRFEPPRPLMHSLGVTPSASSTGERRRQGGITKTGKTHARRACSEGAWASRSPAQVSRHLPRRLEPVSKPIPESRGTAPVRLGTRARPRRARGTKAPPVVVAIAREVRACMWAIAQERALTPSCETLERPAAVCPRCAASLGSGAAPVWCHPRRRAEAARNPRAATEAGTRRTPGRWAPIHGEPQAHPSSLPGSTLRLRPGLDERLSSRLFVCASLYAR